MHYGSVSMVVVVVVVVVVAYWLLEIPATCWCISRTDMLRQVYVLSHQHTSTDQTFYLTLSPYTDTGPTSTSADPITPSASQCSHRSTTV